jgi:hypothetical protein
MQSNVRDNVLFSSPKDEAERAAVAGTCVRKLGIKFPAMVDSFDNQGVCIYRLARPALSDRARRPRSSTRANPGHSAFIPEDLAGALQKAVGNP